MRQKSRNTKSLSRTGRERHPPGHAQAIWSRREDPHCAGGPARRGVDRRVVPARRHRGEPVLQLSKEFLEAGKKRLAGDTARAATSDEVKALRKQAGDLKEVVAEQALELRILKKSMIADGGDDE